MGGRGGHSIAVKGNCFLQRNLISPSYSVLGGNTPHTAARRIESAKTSIAFPSVKERIMAFLEAVQQCSKSQINNTVLKELLVVKPGASLNYSDVLNHSSVLSVSSETTHPQDKKWLMVFLGKDGVVEQALNILDQQIPRARKGKEPYDIIFMNQSVKADYEKSATICY